MEDVINDVTNKETKSNTVFDKFKGLFAKEKTAFTAEMAWLESTYGAGMAECLEKRIANKQIAITETIKSKFRYACANNNHASYSSYHCVVDIEEDLAAHTVEIFEPFKANGFSIINLSESVDEIEDENVYLISWKHIFRKEKNGEVLSEINNG